MLLSPPLTADSGPSSPRSLKRVFSETSYDEAVTPPLSQPVKRRRCSSSEPQSYSQDLEYSNSAAPFDPAALISPPEYAFTPYDADFGRKVCKAYRKSLQAKHATVSLTRQLRRQKYGLQDAEAYSPGSTPDHLRSRYEDSQRQMDQLAEDIIANSDSEGEGGSFVSGTSSAELKELLQKRRAQSRLARRERRRRRKDSQSSDNSLSTHSDEPGLDSKPAPRHATLLRSDDYDETTHDGARFGSHGRIGLRCTTRDEYSNGQGRSFGKEFWSSYIAAS